MKVIHWDVVLKLCWTPCKNILAHWILNSCNHLLHELSQYRNTRNHSRGLLHLFSSVTWQQFCCHSNSGWLLPVAVKLSPCMHNSSDFPLAQLVLMIKGHTHHKYLGFKAVSIVVPANHDAVLEFLATSSLLYSGTTKELTWCKKKVYSVSSQDFCMQLLIFALNDNIQCMESISCLIIPHGWLKPLEYILVRHFAADNFLEPFIKRVYPNCLTGICDKQMQELYWDLSVMPCLTHWAPHLIL